MVRYPRWDVVAGKPQSPTQATSVGTVTCEPAIDEGFMKILLTENAAEKLGCLPFGKRNIIFKIDFSGDMLVSRRVLLCGGGFNPAK